MENVKLTKEQVYCLEQSKFYHGIENYKELILKSYLLKDLISMEWQDLDFLSELSLEEVMNILLGNFEVKKEGIDLVTEEFFRVKNNQYEDETEIGYLLGIEFAVKSLGFELKK